MRENLFRGKTTKKELPIREFNEIWVYGDLIKSNGKYYIHPQANQVKVESEIGKLICMHEVIPETVGKFICDYRKRVRIFEGDILQLVQTTFDHRQREEEPRTVVLYIEYGNDGLPRLFLPNKKGSLPFFPWNYSEIEVIGNIHDNPELLESK